MKCTCLPERINFICYDTDFSLSSIHGTKYFETLHPFYVRYLNKCPSDIIKFPDYPWNWEYISRNVNITMDVVNHCIDKPWSFYYLSMNKAITMMDIINHPQYNWQIMEAISK